MLKVAKWITIIIVLVYTGICVWVYFDQEKLIFIPERLPQNHQFSFSGNFKELNIRMNDGAKLNALLFKTEHPKGLIFYLHGNGGSLRGWGESAEVYNALGYDVFMPDYRGYGKNQGHIGSQQQLFNDCQVMYADMAKQYPENKIIILGYSVGTGIAAHLASENHCQKLILQAPYYNFTEMKNEHYPILPSFIMRYTFDTNLYLKICKAPVVVFHGDADEVINYNSSLKLKQEFKPGDTLITLKGQGHMGITDNPQYLAALKGILK
ncbi:MAG: alpha/beta fold hydrolase [Mucilaginibacter sp.]|nr:alpha/beta fold hydrolase [Mucilaginibacter sp.]